MVDRIITKESSSSGEAAKQADLDAPAEVRSELQEDLDDQSVIRLVCILSCQSDFHSDVPS